MIDNLFERLDPRIYTQAQQEWRPGEKYPVEKVND